MADEKFFLGYTQTLQKVPFVGGPGSPPPYTLHRQRERLVPKLTKLGQDAAQVPKLAAPRSEVVAVVRLHPRALSRSAFPEALLRAAEWRFVGSLAARVRPDEAPKASIESESLTTDLLVAGRPDQFNTAISLLMDPRREGDRDRIGLDLRGIEDVRLMSREDRTRSHLSAGKDDLEIVLHYDAYLDAEWLPQFTRFAKHVGISVDEDLAFRARSLLFIPATGSGAAAKELADFTFLRTVRPLPTPRPLERPRLLRSTKKVAAKLPNTAALDASTTVAIFDGGLPNDHPFKAWATAIEPLPAHDIGKPVPDYISHGIAVTSAALFGSLSPDEPAPTPFCRVDHYRVLGSNTHGKKGLYRALALIDDVLQQRDYAFVSLSLGPPEPIDDGTVSPWTCLLDDHLGTGAALAAVAVGNNGEDAAPQSRVMAPSDSVNALGVGACDSVADAWARASYSAIGPGRSPGLIKPDLVHFGGVDGNEFVFAGPNDSLFVECGTSFATPGLVRIAAGLRAHFGPKLTAMALKALLIHGSECEEHPAVEVGWGRCSHDVAELALCPDGHARIVYSGKLTPGAVLRAPILVPARLPGNVSIRATVCYSCATDPMTPGDYTRAGLDVTFRPNASKFNANKAVPGKKPMHPASDSFFKRHDHIPEEERRLVAQKWNTVMRGEVTKRASNLEAPCFDIHYVAREAGSATTPSAAPEIHYGMVVSVVQPRVTDLYERVLAEFPLQVSTLMPVIPLTGSVEVTA
jgi:hypothetical protein